MHTLIRRPALIRRSASFAPQSLRARLAAAAAAIISAAALAAAGAGSAAYADPAVRVSADQTTISVGGTTTITASGLGGLARATFGLDDTTMGVFSGSGSAAYTGEVLSNGTSVATFQALKAGTVTIAVGDGESVLGTVAVTVTGSARGGARVVVDPTTIRAGQTATVTATGLGGLQKAVFGQSGPGGGAFAGGGSSVSVSVTGGTASTSFTAGRAGTFTIAVGDGETPLATTTVTVAAAPTPSPAPTPTVTPTVAPVPTPTVAPAPVPSGSGVPLGIVIVIVAVVLIAAGAVAWMLVARARRAERH